MKATKKAPKGTPRVSVVVPVKNEEGNIRTLVDEIVQAATDIGPFEVIYVDDGSTDTTPSILTELSESYPWFHWVKHKESCGQSAAVRTGVRHATAPVVVTMDGDGQNNPAYIPEMLSVLEAGGDAMALVAGQRTGRKDGKFKSFQSKIANRVRGAILRDGTRDTGCGLKMFKRDVYLALPYFDALHRFMPALVKREGFGIGYVDVVDRTRYTGVSNYGLFDRLWVSIMDLAGVWWLIRRRRRVPQVQKMD
ncbi:glycosyltransferase family 2 protein [Microvirga sp. W0021]|uniref:Glycosyltransferase family 2 protein n=1 Tax=Hohaiivirga grylli TaxID=3133970 RepID=A0ABV0BIB6_9HYPH